MKQDNTVNALQNKIRCERCGEVLDEKKAKWLELSQTDGNYYSPDKFPKEHISQGGFSFGTACATAQMKETIAAIKPTTQEDKGMHTPGEWEAKQITDSQIIIGIKEYGEGDNYRADNRCGQIAKIVGWDGDKTSKLSTEDKANAALIASAPTLKAERDALATENEQIKKLLHELTPGGSEFYNDPEYCAKWIRENRQENHYSLTKIISETKAERDKLVEDVKVLREALGELIEVFKGAWATDKDKETYHKATEAINQTKQS